MFRRRTSDPRSRRLRRAASINSRGEPLDPPVQGHVVDIDATLGEKLFQVPVGPPVPQVLADRQQDHLRGGKRNPVNADGTPPREPD